MAKVKLNPILENISGDIGDLVFKRYQDQTIIARKPDQVHEPTPAQQAHRDRFREAVLYGKMVAADPQTKALYEQAAQAQGKPFFALMVADFFHAPTIDSIDLTAYTGAVGDPITIRAHDDFAVAAVTVTLTTANGDPIETGPAQETAGAWTYTATTAVPAGTTVRVAVVAADRPGSQTETQETAAL